MGMHLGIIAVQTQVSHLLEAFSQVWPKLKVESSADGFSDLDALWSWKSENERFVSAAEWSKENRGSEVYFLCQDGPWSVLIDHSYVLPSDEESLKNLSSRFGTVLSFIVETSGGCSFFWCYDSGDLRRAILNSDGEITLSGSTLPQEAGIDINHYYMDETEQLMKAFGMSRPENLPILSSTIAISTTDLTDYSELTSSGNAEQFVSLSESNQQSKPWWKFW